MADGVKFTRLQISEVHIEPRRMLYTTLAMSSLLVQMKALKCTPLALLLTSKLQILVLAQGSSSML